MRKLPVVSGREAIKALVRAGFKIARQRGSHVSLYKEGKGRTLITVIPLHSELRKGTLRAIVKQAGMTVEEFMALLR